MLRKNNFCVIFFCFFNILIGVIYIKPIIGVVEWPYNDIDGDNIYEINREIINKIVECKSKFLKAISYYTTLAFLLVDPLYLTIIYKFVGGGDMNGILLIGIPEVVIQLIFAIITMSNILLTIKKIYPAYKKVLVNNKLQFLEQIVIENYLLLFISSIDVSLSQHKGISSTIE